MDIIILFISKNIIYFYKIFQMLKPGKKSITFI